jgi:hypothetical protein
MKTYEIKWTHKSCHSQFEDCHTKSITIKPGPGAYANRLYQREITRMNGVVIYSADYPADTEYAAQQLDGMTEVAA